jgi:hypothetical protein
MRYTRFALAALIAVSAACSNEERETSFISEAQAATAQPDGWWRTPGDFSSPQEEVRDYY